MKKEKQVYERILQTALEIVKESGALYMSMDRVSARAGVSKGGLMYHFPTQRHLLEAILDRFISEIKAYRHGISSRFSGAEREFKTYLATWLNLSKRHKKTAIGLLAAVTRQPKLIARVRREVIKRWNEIIKKDEIPTKGVLALAAQGMCLAEILGIQPFTQSERRKLEKAILEFVDRLDKMK